MPPSFTKPLAERFNNLCQLNVEEVKDDQVVLAGTIYIAPSGYQTKLKKDWMAQLFLKSKIQKWIKHYISHALI